jgi:fucose 4-O-acetylase-like acetyltransferase
MGEGMKVIKFVQWQSAILIGLVTLEGMLAIVIPVLSVSDWVAFAPIALLFVLPETAAAFFGPVLKRKQEGNKGNEN